MFSVQGFFFSVGLPTVHAIDKAVARNTVSDKKTWFITGAGRGLGVEIAKAALAAGHAVVATGRDPRKVAIAVGHHPEPDPHAVAVRRLPAEGAEDQEIEGAWEEFHAVRVGCWVLSVGGRGGG